MKKVALVFIIMLLFVPCVSAETSIFLSAVTYHLDRDDDLNEQNQAIGIIYNNFFATTFSNSHDNRSWFLGYSLRTKKYQFYKEAYVRGNLYLGALYGYEDDLPNVDGWSLGATPTGEIGIKHFAVELMANPADGGVLSLMLKYTF